MPHHQSSRNQGRQPDAMLPNNSNTAPAADVIPPRSGWQSLGAIPVSDSAMDALAAVMSTTGFDSSDTQLAESTYIPAFSTTMTTTESDTSDRLLTGAIYASESALAARLVVSVTNRPDSGSSNSQVDESVSASDPSAADTTTTESLNEQSFESEIEEVFPSDPQDELADVMPSFSFFGDLDNISPELYGGIEDGALAAPATHANSDSNLDDGPLRIIDIPSGFFEAPLKTIDIPSAFCDHELAGEMVYRLVFELGDTLQRSIEDEDFDLRRMDSSQRLHPESLRKARFYCQMMIASAFQATQGHPEEAEAYYYRNKIAHMKTLDEVSSNLSSIAENWEMQFSMFVYKIDLLPDNFRAEACKALVDLSEKFWKTSSETEQQVLDLFTGLAMWISEVWLHLVKAEEQSLRHDKRRALLHRIVDQAPQQEELLSATRALVNSLDNDDRRCMICLEDFEVFDIAESALTPQLQEYNYESNWSPEWSDEEGQSSTFSSGWSSNYSTNVQPWLSVDENLCSLTIKESFERVPIKMPCGHIFCAMCINTWMNKFDRALQCPLRDYDLGAWQDWANIVKKYAFLSKKMIRNGGFIEADAHEPLGDVRHLDERSDEERLREYVGFAKRIGVAFGRLN